jgi:Holliday junction resolvase RusA-like endonuclease
MKLKIDYMPPNWNEYINMERANKYKASKLKKEEKQIIKMLTLAKRYTGDYPVELTLKPHFSSMRQDLDNFRYKGILDGLVSAGVIINDNLKHIRKITIEPIFDDAECVEIEIKELKNEC